MTTTPNNRVRVVTREYVVHWQRTNVPHEGRISTVVLRPEYETVADIPAILAARHNILYRTDIRIFHVNEAPEELA